MANQPSTVPTAASGQRPGVAQGNGAQRPAPVTAQFTIQPLAEKKRYLKLLAYGAPGVGKTRLCGSAHDVPAMRDVLFIDLEDGTLSIDDAEGIDLVTVNQYRTLARVQEFVTLHCQFRDKANAGDKAAEAELLRLQRQYMGDAFDDRLRKYNTIVIDSLSAAHRLGMAQILNNPVNVALDSEPGTPEIRDWGKILEMMLRLLRRLRDTPVHVLTTAQERMEEDYAKRKYRTPDLPGQAAKKIQNELDVVMYLMAATEGDKTVRRGYVQPRPQLDAKNRLKGMTAPTIDNPTIADLVKFLDKQA